MNEPRKCSALGRTFSRCGKRNHFTRLCNSVRDSAKKVNKVDQMSDEDSSDEEYVKEISFGWMRSGAGRKATVKFPLDGVKVLMAIDSGATVNVIEEESFLKTQERSRKIDIKKRRRLSFTFMQVKPRYPLLENLRL